MTKIETLLKNDADIIALDGDGVLFDYNQMYANVWEKAFGEKPTKNAERAYHAKNQYAMHFASLEHKKHFYDTFAEHGWEDMMPLPGAVEACKFMSSLGFSLVIVSTMPPEHKEKRLANAKKLNMPIEHVHAAFRPLEEKSTKVHNPKKPIIDQLQPVAFLDDLLTNFYDLDSATHCAWMRWNTFDNPNPETHIAWADSIHDTMPEFAKWVYDNQDELRNRKRQRLNTSRDIHYG